MLTDANLSSAAGSASAAATVSEGQFTLWSGLLQARLGMDPRSLRPGFLSRVLSQRLLDLGLADMQQYYELLHSGEQPGEWLELLDRVTTHETRFFRQPGSLDVVTSHCRQLMQQGRNVRIWSAGCASGEETWTLAMLMAELHDELPAADYMVLGTDISHNCLRSAREGNYPQRRAGNVPRQFADKYLLRPGPDTVRIGAELRQRTAFGCMDILAPTGITGGSMDVVYCHNMLIYMDQPNREQALNNMAQALNTDGILITGPGEARNWNNPALHKYLDGDITLYRKIRS